LKTPSDHGQAREKANLRENTWCAKVDSVNEKNETAKLINSETTTR